MDVEALTLLSDRMEGLSGPSEEVDALILCALAAPAGSFVERSRINGAWCIHTEDKDRSGAHRLWERTGKWYRREGWPLTSSLDATVALVERATKVEPIAMVEKAIANLLERGWNPNIPFGPQLSRAILRALIAAKIEEAETRSLALTELAELDAEEIISIPTAYGDGE